LLGQTPRQVRYLIKNGRLRASKEAGRWVIDDGDLPLSEGQRRSAERKTAELATAVEEALGPQQRKGRPYSVRDIRAFERGVSCWRAAKAAYGEHPATSALGESLVLVAQGCHRYHGREKAVAFQDARERAAEAVARLHLEGGEAAVSAADGVEQDYIPLLAGLVRRYERRGRP
jgi:hypothetical protein